MSKNEENEVRADLSISVHVTCPNCDHYFDLIDNDDDAFVLDQLLPDDRWRIDADERLQCEVECPHCGVEFSVKGVNW